MKTPESFNNTVERISALSTVIRYNNYQRPEMFVWSAQLENARGLFLELGLTPWQFECCCDNYLGWMEWARGIMQQFQLECPEGNGEKAFVIIGGDCGEFYRGKKEIHNNVRTMNGLTRRLAEIGEAYKKRIGRRVYTAYPAAQSREH